MESIGEILREARHQKQVALEDVSRLTKIKVEILEQLEADEFDRLVSPTYTKGFLKLYAEHLGLDSQALVAAYVKSQGGLQRKGLHIETVETAHRRRPELKLSARSLVILVGGLTVAVVAVLLIKGWWTRAPQPVSTKSTQAIVAAPVMPRADFEPLYQPKSTAPALLEVPQ